MALSLLITLKFTILHGLEYIHYPVDIIHRITIFRTQVISGLSEPTICFPNHNFLIEICPLLNPTNICAHSLRFFANFWFPCLCQLSLNWWSRWRVNLVQLPPLGEQCYLTCWVTRQWRKYMHLTWLVFTSSNSVPGEHSFTSSVLQWNTCLTVV